MDFLIFSVHFKNKIKSMEERLRVLTADRARQLQETHREKERVRTLLNGMVEGVLVTDEEGRISVVNPALEAMLDLASPYVGRKILECCRNASLHESIESVLAGSPEEEREIVIHRGLEERFFVVHTAPLRRDRQEGSVSVFYDVTKIRQLENMRKEFVANVSHELKTPLTSILGYAETLRRGALSDPEAAGRFVEKIESNAGQLKNLVEDLLKISEIESGRMEIVKVPVRLEELVTSVAADFEEAVRKKRIHLSVQIPKTLEVTADTSALRQVLGNLIDNAIKYTGEGGRIEVSAVREGTACRVTVADTGIGISEKDLPHVFERFYRADKARSREMGGTGLGLAIMKHLVQAHGGEAGVKSEVGKGTEFWFTVPLATNIASATILIEGLSA